MDFTLWASYIAVSAINITTPGPANMNLTRWALLLGVSRTLPYIIGNSFGLAIGGIFCASGFIFLVQQSETLWLITKFMGFGYLIFLGLTLIFKTEIVRLDKHSKHSLEPLKLFAEAFVIAVSNMKALLFFIALFPRFIGIHSEQAWSSLIMILTYCVLSILSLSAYAVFAHMLRGRLLSQKRYDTFRKISGLTLIVFAVSNINDDY